MKKRVFSGIQPTGNIHLGNYLGAVKHWVDSQNEFDNIFCIVNSHAITVKQNPAELKAKTYELAAILLACGIDTQKSKLFIQSEVDEHAALAWILDCNIPMGDMSRMTQFKDKSQKNPKNINIGLFNYPALMAADILLYQSDLVPVGEDQKQHLELTRDVAARFNRDYGETFKIPEPMIPKIGARIMGLDDPSKKMSKSESKPNHGIALLDSPEDILKKFKRATTDSENLVRFNPDQAGIYNLLSIYQSFTGDSCEAIEARFEGKGYGTFKVAVAEAVIEGLRPIRESYAKLIEDRAYLQSVLNQSANEVRVIAQKTYASVKERVGLV